MAAKPQLKSSSASAAAAAQAAAAAAAARRQRLLAPAPAANCCRASCRCRGVQRTTRSKKNKRSPRSSTSTSSRTEASKKHRVVVFRAGRHGLSLEVKWLEVTVKWLEVKWLQTFKGYPPPCRRCIFIVARAGFLTEGLPASGHMVSCTQTNLNFCGR